MKTTFLWVKSYDKKETMLQQYFSVVAALGGASFKYSYTVRYFSAVVPLKGHKINLRRHEIVNGRGKKKKSY